MYPPALSRRASTPRCAPPGCAAPAKRGARLMRAAALVGSHRRRARTTVTDPAHAPAPDMVARDFAAPAPNRLRLGDSTSVPTREGWLYLAVVLDAARVRREQDRLRTELALDALSMALRVRRLPPGLVHHTDRGR